VVRTHSGWVRVAGSARAARSHVLLVRTAARTAALHPLSPPLPPPSPGASPCGV
jgi:hypothetical protein